MKILLEDFINLISHPMSAGKPVHEADGHGGIQCYAFPHVPLAPLKTFLVETAAV